MIKKNNIPITLIIFTVILFNLFAALYYYNYVTGEIEQARLLYLRMYGNDENFNSIFWLCQKIFINEH